MKEFAKTEENDRSISNCTWYQPGTVYRTLQNSGHTRIRRTNVLVLPV